MSPRNAVVLLRYASRNIIANLLINCLSNELANLEIIEKYIGGATSKVLQDVLEYVLNIENLDASTRFRCLQVLLREDVRKLETGVFPHSYYHKILNIILSKGKGLQYLNLKGVWARDEPEMLGQLLLELKKLRVLVMPHIGNDLVLKFVRNCEYLTMLDIAGDCNFSLEGLYELQSDTIRILDIGSYGERSVCIPKTVNPVEVIARLIQNLPNLQILKTYSYVGNALLQIYQTNSSFASKLTYIHDTHTTTEACKAIVKLCPKLESVYLDSPKEKVLNILSELKYLNSLKISRPRKSDLMEYLKESGWQLQVLNINRCKENVLDLSHICVMTPNLRILECFKVNLTYTNPETYFKSLESLEVLYCNISNSIVAYVLTCSPILRRCIIGDVITMTDGDIFRLCAECDFIKLEELWFSCAKRLTATCVELLMGHCPNLRVLGQLNGWDCTYDDIDYLRAIIISTNIHLTLLPLTFLPESDYGENVM